MIDMMTATHDLSMAMLLVNFALCSAICWSCLCRVALMSAHVTRLRFRLGYTVIMVAATSSALSPWLWNEWPGPGQICMGIAVAYFLGWGAGNWRHGTPAYALLGAKDSPWL
jgi:hypothetical protein